MPDPALELTSSQMRGALGLAGDLAACRTKAEMTEQMLLLGGLIGSDTVLVGEVVRADRNTATLSAADGPPGTFDEETIGAFTRLWQQHPVVTRHFGEPARGAMKISDFLNRRSWRRTALFGECYGSRLGIGWEIASQIRFDPRNQACVALGRAGRDFDERDRAFLDLVNPHLRAACGRLDREATRDSRLDLLERGIESSGEVVLVVDRRGRVISGAPGAAGILADWFDDRPGAAHLPSAVAAWRRLHRGSPEPPPLTLDRADRRLRMQLIPGQEEDAILISERRNAAPDPAVLAARLPLTRREAEVLALLAQGHIDASIAVELELSPNTVGRYIERIYAKLDVHNRVAAATAVRDALAD
jgi:DNA-binding CsgD family transcriptional regulator